MQFVSTFFLIVVCFSVTELFLLVRVSAAIGFAQTLGLCILTGVLGGALVRYQGLLTLQRLRKELAGGRLPTDEILEGVVLIVIGALLCVPGFVTDVLGFLMLIPPLRRETIAWFKKRVKPRFTFHSGTGWGPGAPFPGPPDDPRAGRPESEGGGPFSDEKPDIIDAKFEKKPPREE